MMQHLPPMDPWGANGAQPMQPQQQYYAGAGLPQQPHQQAPYPGAGPQQPQQYYGQPQPQQAQQYPASGPNYGGGLAQQQAAPHGYPGANGPAAYLQQQQYGQQQPPYGGYQAQAPLQPMPQPQPQQQLLQPALKPQQRPPMGAGQQVAIIDGRYCSPQPLQLIMKEAITMGSYGSDNFHIMDAHGRTHFMLRANNFSMSDKRVLMDASGQPVVGMAKKLLSMKPTWIMYRGASFAQGTQVAVVKAHHSLTPSVSVYLNDGDKESDFKIRGNFRSKRFAITQKLGSGGQERPIAEVKKESKFSSVTAFLTSAMTAADNYFIHIEPGVDAAFIVAIAVLVDELFHDEKTT